MKATMPRLFLVLFCLFAQTASATGLERMKEYFQNIQTLQAGFHQVVTDKQGRKTQDVTGNMRLQKPNKFRWDYNKPFVQEILGDGEHIWIYDPELNQVTVRALSKVTSSSPATLLAGGKDIERYFTVKDVSRKGDLEWVLAIPKVGETGFERVFLGFKGDEVMAMELQDRFGNRTYIEFTNIERNPKFARDLFKFNPPHDADVVGE